MANFTFFSLQNGLSVVYYGYTQIKEHSYKNAAVFLYKRYLNGICFSSNCADPVILETDAWLSLLSVGSQRRWTGFCGKRSRRETFVGKAIPIFTECSFCTRYGHTICIIAYFYTEIWGFPFNMRIICRFYTYRSIPKCKL